MDEVAMFSVWTSFRLFPCFAQFCFVVARARGGLHHGRLVGKLAFFPVSAHTSGPPVLSASNGFVGRRERSGRRLAFLCLIVVKLASVPMFAFAVRLVRVARFRLVQLWVFVERRGLFVFLFLLPQHVMCCWLDASSPSNGRGAKLMG